MNGIVMVIESEFEYKSVKCIVTFNSMGFRCGYIQIPKNHKFIGMDYENIHEYCYIEVHGGLTYASDHVTGHSDEKDSWWIGFDCGHCNDATELDVALDYFKDDATREMIEELMKVKKQFSDAYDGEIRTKEYVIEECKSLVDQILKHS